MTTVAELHALANDVWRHAPPNQWWKQTAALCLAQGRAQIIPGRRGDDVYLLRCWLSTPREAATEAHVDGARWESGNALLLHHFLRPDDDGALHDHPWGFISDILCGEYIERRPLPPEDLRLEKRRQNPGEPGPAAFYDELHNAPEQLVRKANDLHSIIRVQPDTWTLVRTGRRVRDWGFHPTDRPWVPWREYLAELGHPIQDN
jgi:hypothetical protein